MLSVPVSVQNALDASGRQIRAKVVIHFTSPLTVTGSDYLVGFDSLEEEYIDSADIFGMMSSNECSITLLNTNRIFSVTNISSPYYGQLKPGLKVVVTFQIFTTIWEDVPLGTFYTVEWPLGTTGTTVEVLCRDRLYAANKKTVSAIVVQRNMTVQNAIQNLFINAGVTNYNIGVLDYQISYWWHNDSTLGEQLQKFVTGYGVRIYVDKADNIVVVKARSGSSVKNLTGSNQILGLTSAADSRYLFSKVNVSYIANTVVETTLYYALANGTNLLKTVVPTLLVKATNTDAVITSLAFDSDKITIAVGADASTEILIDSLKQESKITVVADSGLVASYGDIVKNLTTEIAQSSVEATLLAQMALNEVRVEKVLMANVRGYFPLELGDKVTLTNVASATTGDYYITKMKYEFTGSLVGMYTLLKS